MDREDLEKLQAAVEWLVDQAWFAETVATLRHEIESSAGFVWTTVPIDTFPTPLPDAIESCWVFELKGGVASGCHLHPNSVQHMVAIRGVGRSEIGGRSAEVVAFGSPDRPIEDQWSIIDTGVGHEFFPGPEGMTVVSFHTCTEDELEEIDCGTGSSRLYEPAEHD